MRRCDVFIEYTKPDTARANVAAALEHGAHVVIGTSGLTEQDYAEIDAAAREGKRGVLAVGNFALTVALLQKFVRAARGAEEQEAVDHATRVQRVRGQSAPAGSTSEESKRS